MELREVLAALRAAWWLPAIGLLMGGVAALVVSLLTTPQYTTRIQMFVSTTDTTSTSDVFQGSQFSQQRVTSYARLLKGDELLSRVIDDLNLDLTPDALADQVTANAVTETVLLDVSVTDVDPVRARDIARAIGEAFRGLVAELETPDGATVSPVKVTVVDQPEVADKPSAPKSLVNVAMGLAIGLLVGALVAIGRAKFDRSLRDADEAARIARAPVIGTILQDDALQKRHVLERGTVSRTAEDYRQLRTNLQYVNVDKPPRVIMVSSALASEGKTTLAVNLSVALAEAGRRVTILEADLRRPRVTQYMGLVSGAGLTNILSGSAEVEDVLQSFGEDKLSVIAAGPAPPNPGELLASSHMLALIDELRRANDFVIIDAPPLLPVADSTGLAAFVDGVVLSVRYGSTRRDQLAQAIASLDRVQAKTLGIVLNIVPSSAREAGAYGYGYSYHHDADRTPVRSG